MEYNDDIYVIAKDILNGTVTKNYNGKESYNGICILHNGETIAHLPIKETTHLKRIETLVKRHLKGVEIYHYGNLTTAVRMIKSQTVTYQSNIGNIRINTRLTPRTLHRDLLIETYVLSGSGNINLEGIATNINSKVEKCIQTIIPLINKDTRERKPMINNDKSSIQIELQEPYRSWIVMYLIEQSGGVKEHAYSLLDENQSPIATTTSIYEALIIKHLLCKGEEPWIVRSIRYPSPNRIYTKDKSLYKKVKEIMETLKRISK